MTKNDYMRLAKAIREAYNHSSFSDPTLQATHHVAVIVTANRIANQLFDDNPKFSHAKFIEACGIGI